MPGEPRPPAEPARILLTGAAGRIGAMLRARLARPRRTMRLLDTAGLGPASDGEELVAADLTDPAALIAACAGVDAVIHLAGIPREDAWDQLRAVNIDGTRHLLEAARVNGVRRVVLASSTHVAGFHAPPDGTPLAVDVQYRPDGYYGVSKVATEALGALYHDRFGMDVVCVRIGACSDRPTRRRSLFTWLSPDDAGRLFEACVSAPAPGFRVVWGVSANSGGWFSLDEAEALGYRPRDDAAVFADDPRLAGTELTAAERAHIGGRFTTEALGAPG